MSKTVMTVTGRIRPDEVGVTLMHEHLLIDLAGVIGPPADIGPEPIGDGIHMADLADIGWSPDAFFSPLNADLSDPAMAADEARAFADAGGQTIVELTPIGLRRDVALLPSIAAAAGINVVVGSAWFREGARPASASVMSADQLAATIVDVFEQGIEGTSVRPGIIGEIGPSSPIGPWEIRSLRASVIAARTTGMAMSVHVDRWQKEGLRIVDILEEAGADLSRVVIGHLNTTVDDIGYHLALARRGVVLGYDLCGSEVPRAPGRFPPRDSELLPALERLIADGHEDQIVLSHDLSFKTEYRRYGGRGYGHIPRRVVPLLRDHGIASMTIDRITRSTPTRLLTLRPRG